MLHNLKSLPLFPSNVNFYLDMPPNRVTSTGFWVLGWAIEKSDNISKISIYLSGNKIVDIKEKHSRPDVANAFPIFVNAGNSGFAHFLHDIVPGKYLLQVTVTLMEKEYLAISKVIEVEPPHTIDQVSKIMKNDWNQRAENDAERWIYGKSKSEKPEVGVLSSDEYYESSRQQPIEAFNLLKQLFPTENFSKQKMLEIGCGIGRLSISFSKFFEHYIGIDVSEKMIEIAKTNLNGINNVEFFANNGIDLQMINNNFVDFIFEGYVFQHIPQKNIVENYCKEAFRILKTGGHFMALFWKNQLEPHIQTHSKYLYQGQKIDITNDTILGVQFSQEEIQVMLAKIGFKNIIFLSNNLLTKDVHHLVVASKN